LPISSSFAGNGQLREIIQLIQITINGNPRSFELEAMTVGALVEKLGLTGKRLAIERNGEIVPKSTFAEVALQNGDKLEIVGAVGGG
jgi:sulfur carrier protein